MLMKSVEQTFENFGQHFPISPAHKDDFLAKKYKSFRKKFGQHFASALGESFSETFRRIKRFACPLGEVGCTFGLDNCLEHV